MKKENDTILVSLVMIIVILISANNIVIQKTNQVEEVIVEQINRK